MDEVIERYLRLGLRVGRHVDGIVDAYYGPRDLADEVDAAPPVEPRELVDEAESLLGELDDGWLRDQVSGLHTYARVLAGDQMAYADEVERCYGVRPVHTDEAVFEAAHAQLDALLPGDGSLAERFHGWQSSAEIPGDRLEHVLAAVIEEARAQTRELVGLPDEEDVELEIVRDKAWLAFCGYQGGFHSRIEVNVDLPQTGIDLLHLAIHETYPGHHTEASLKEQLLVRGEGHLEHTILLVPTPQSLVAEGIAELASELLLDGPGRTRLAAVVQETTPDFDLEHARAVERARQPCGWSGVNAALMLHEDGATADDVRAYLCRWGLLTEERAEHAVRFMQEPTSRSYVINYDAGLALCRTYVGGDVARFRRLLTEPVRVGELVSAARRAAI